jgi:hypothetical protein
MVLQIVLRQLEFGSFLMVPARSIALVVFVSAATSSTMVIYTLGYPTIYIQLLSPAILVMMVINYFNIMTAHVHIAFISRLKLKL